MLDSDKNSGDASVHNKNFSEFGINEAEGLHKGYDRMQKILSQLNQLKAKPEDEDINLKFLMSFAFIKVSGPNNSAFVSATSTNRKMSYVDSPSYSSSTYTVPSNSKTGSQRSEKMDLEEMDLKWQIGYAFCRVHKFKQKAGRKIDFEKTESARFNNKKVRMLQLSSKEATLPRMQAKGGNDKQRYSSFNNHGESMMGQSDGVIASKEFGMIAGCDNEDEIKEGAAKLYNLITGVDKKEVSTVGDAGEFALMGVTSEAGHFKKNASSVSKLCFVYGSRTHLIKDCDFYEKQMANKIVGNGVGQYLILIAKMKGIFDRGFVLEYDWNKQQFNLFSILSDLLQENRVLFTDTDCLMLSKNLTSNNDNFGPYLDEPQRTKSVPPGSIPVPTGSIEIPSGGTTISPGNVSDPYCLNQEVNAQTLNDPSWVDAMQEEMQQFKFQNVWVLVDLPAGKYAIGTKWILKNKRDARGIVVRNKARLVAQGHKRRGRIELDESFAPLQE
ncbi:ribonuclease H-like domain-containing protein [Tanacetum coccineum]|uniref:Ribonuclease H-like domain-containing protein n=1 Tax=Tanacetum coccineum TaxID=301880 RepID=A0ABQ4Y1N3_9ASTR